MIKITEALQKRFVASFTQGRVGEKERGAYLKWLRYYLDFCSKYGCVATDLTSLTPFVEKLREKGQSEGQRQQARAAIKLHYEICPIDRIREGTTEGLAEPVIPYPTNISAKSEKVSVSLSSHLSGQKEGESVELHIASPFKNTSLDRKERQPAEPYPLQAATLASTAEPAQAVTFDAAPAFGSSWQKEYQRLTDEIRLRHYSSKTLRTYRNYVSKFQTFTKSIEPGLLTTDHVKDFLTDLAVKKQVAASTQNLAFNSLLFFYRNVLGREFGKVEGV